MDPSEALPEDDLENQTIGAYRLVEEIGRGGMGAVYRAERVDGEFDQTVAIKLIKRGMDTDLILRRFRRERQILASLNHPNIAYFLGGGSTESGLPYFVMEFIDGLPLYKFCDRNALGIRDRLSVFRQVCWAVAAAHEAKVIHRDLKPSNIMVKPDGKPKLLDFGIAKVLDPELYGTDGDPTATQMRAMTPEYASPEQMSGEAVEAASDIYSLGVILYELLTGHRPYQLRRSFPQDAARIIQEEMPTNPSSSIALDSGLVPVNGNEMTLERIYAARSTTASDLRSQLTGDIDKVVLKALRKSPSDRYRTVIDLADDITNLLDGNPVKAEFALSLSSIPNFRKSAKRSIAILPLQVISQTRPGNTGSEFVGIGLADALISRLSAVRRLIVRPTTSIIPFGGTNAVEAARQLEVDFVLDGSVRIVGGRIRVSVQLYSAERGNAEWARSFDKDLGDVLELEDSIAEQVTESLIPQLTTEERSRLDKRSTNKPEAYEAYLRGRYFWSRFTDDGLVKAVDEFNKAVEIDPEYALPYIGLSDYYIWAAIFGEIPSAVGFPLAQEAARKALEIDSSLGEAYAALAFTVLLYDWNWSDSEYLAKRAIELSPNYPFAHEVYSNFLASQGRFDEGIEEILIAEELDPVSPRAILMSAWTLYQARRFEESVGKARKAVAMQESFPQGWLHLGNALAQFGETDEAIEVLRKSAEHWGRSGMPRYMLAHARAAEGNTEAVASILEKMLAIAKEGHMKPYFVAMTFVAAGDHDSAFEWFRKAADEHNEWMAWFGTEPKLDAIRNDKRYAEILALTNNPIQQRDADDAGSRRDTGERAVSIAILPFRSITSDSETTTEDRYLSFGIADATTIRLSNVRRFIVRPTSSVLAISEETDPHQAGVQLGVEFVLSGIIRRLGDRIRLTAQLIDVSDNSTRWSASFDENITDLLELEDILSDQVIRAVLPRLTGEDERLAFKRETNVREAHDAYLQGRYFWNQVTSEAFLASYEAFSKAVELDPNYALAHVGIADYYMWASIYGMVSPAESYDKVRGSALAALAIEPDLPEAMAALGLYHSNNQDFDEAEKLLRNAIASNPNYPLAHEWLAAVLVGTGRSEEGIRECITAERLDPLSLRPKVLSAWTLYQVHDFTAAKAKAEELYELNPNLMQSNLQFANILLETGDHEKALEHSTKAVAVEPLATLPAYVHCFALAANGKTVEIGGEIEKLLQLSQRMYVPPFFLGMCYLASGEIDKTFEYFEAAQAEKSARLVWFGTEPKLAVLHHDPRFLQLLSSMRNPIMQRFCDPVASETKKNGS